MNRWLYAFSESLAYKGPKYHVFTVVIFVAWGASLAWALSPVNQFVAYFIGAAVGFHALGMGQMVSSARARNQIKVLDDREPDD